MDITFVVSTWVQASVLPGLIVHGERAVNCVKDWFEAQQYVGKAGLRHVAAELPTDWPRGWRHHVTDCVEHILKGT